MRRICLYHSRDLDGWTSAAIVKRRMPETELIGYDYGDEIPKELLNAVNCTIVIVDISLPIQAMKDIALNNNLYWIDHHISAIEDMKNSPDDDGKQKVLSCAKLDSSFAACELTWKFFFDDPMPEAVRLLGLYDSFRSKPNPALHLKVRHFQYWARAEATCPEEAEVFLMMDDRDVELSVRAGSRIFEYLRIEADGIFKNGFPIMFGPHKFICFNQQRFNPVTFGIDYHSHGYDGAACFWIKYGRMHWSLYNDNGDVDVSKICKQLGGGGHQGAAGFVCGFTGMPDFSGIRSQYTYNI